MKKTSGIPTMRKEKSKVMETVSQSAPVAVVSKPVAQPAASKIPKMSGKVPAVSPAAQPIAVKTQSKTPVKTPSKPAAVEAKPTPKQPTQTPAVASSKKSVVAESSKKTPSKKVVVEPSSEEEDLDEDEEDDEEELSGSAEDSSEMDEEESEGSENDEDEDDDDDEEDEEESEEVSGDDDEEEDEEGSDEEFEVQSSSDEPVDSADEQDDDVIDSDVQSDRDEEHKLRNREEQARFWGSDVVGKTRTRALAAARSSGELSKAQFMHTDDLSSDDEEDAQANTIGRVPLHWYDAFDHIGYSIDGKKIAKRSQGDRIDRAIAQRDDPLAMRRVYDMYNDREIVLSERELEIIRRIQSNAFAHPEFNDTPDYVDYFTHEKEIMPLSARDDPKARFVASKWELMKVFKIAQAMKEGRYVMKSKRSVDAEKDGDENKEIYLIWNDAEDEILADSKRMQFHLPAPKMPLPTHAESYNPPAEYLLTDQERNDLEAMDREDRPMNFMPKKHDSLRHVGAYENFVRERFERCLDLYLCPRKLKKRLNIDPESLVPRLPSPKELKPYPNTLALQFLGHKGAVRCIAVSPDGQYLVSGGEDGTVRLWEADTCLCRHVWSLGAPVLTVAWNPEASHGLVAAAVEDMIVLISTATGDADSIEVTESQLSEVLQLAAKNTEIPSSTGGKNKKSEDSQDEDDSADDESSEDEEADAEDSEGLNKSEKRQKALKSGVRWQLRTDNVTMPTKGGAIVGPRVALRFSAPISKIQWHHKGDYLVALCPSAGAGAVSVHQLSKAKSQFPFNKSPGNVQSVAFHPSLPCLIVATQQHVKLYHLVEQKLVKKLLSGCKWLSSFDTHVSGDHIVVGSYDRRVVWFDLDLSSTPYKTLKFHEKAVRDVKFHKRYPLMASASDDGSVHVFHSMVYSDMMKNPMIVPLKVLKGHGVVGDKGVLSIIFHPRQPWIFSAGADGIINLYQDI